MGVGGLSHVEKRTYYLQARYSHQQMCVRKAYGSFVLTCAVPAVSRSIAEKMVISLWYNPAAAPALYDQHCKTSTV
jgi:hypothetical protein